MILVPANFTTANLALAKQPIFAAEISGYARVLTNLDTGIAGQYPWIQTIDDLTSAADDLNGSSSIGDLTITLIDFQRMFTADLAGIVFEGRTLVLKTGFVGTAYADFATLFTGKVSSVVMANNNTCFQIIAQDTRLLMQQVIFLTGDDGQPTSANHPKTFVGHPCDIAQDVLLTELGLSAGEVDSNKFNDYRDQIFAGMLFEFRLTTAPDALEFLEKQIMIPLGGYLRVDAFGVVTPQFWVPLPGTDNPVADINDQNVTVIPELTQSDLMNVLTIRMDKDENDRFLTESVSIDGASEAKYGQQGQQVIEADGLRSAFQGNMIGFQTAAALFSRYGDKNPTVDLVTFWTLCVLEQGDLVTLTHALVPNRVTGVMGVAGQVFEVLSRTWKFSDATVELILVDGSGAVLGGRFKVAPDTIGVWTAESDPNRAKYMFISGADGKYSDSVDGHPLS